MYFGTLISFGIHELTIFSDCNINYKSWSKLEYNYILPKGFKENSIERITYLAESFYFREIEIEVYKLCVWSIYENQIIQIKKRVYIFKLYYFK